MVSSGGMRCCALSILVIDLILFGSVWLASSSISNQKLVVSELTGNLAGVHRRIERLQAQFREERDERTRLNGILEKEWADGAGELSQLKAATEELEGKLQVLNNMKNTLCSDTIQEADDLEEELEKCDSELRDALQKYKEILDRYHKVPDLFSMKPIR
eukprot:Hpha_TRINITY_DN17614_c0_g1::TRINITY_DN17614_c0_g1_i1::g.158744::m.158744